MEALIIYDSNFGNTKKIADELTSAFGSSAKAKSVKDFKKEDLSGKNLLIVGSPINAWRPTKNIIEFLENLNPMLMKEIKTAAFDTRVKSFISGNAAKKIAKRLTNSGAEVVVEPMGFYVTGNEGPLVEGELERAKEWAKSIQSKL
jgi:flavodoxin